MHSFRIVSGETMWKLCLSTKFLHKEIRLNYGILRSVSSGLNTFSFTNSPLNQLKITLCFISKVASSKSLYQDFSYNSDDLFYECAEWVTLYVTMWCIRMARGSIIAQWWFRVQEILRSSHFTIYMPRWVINRSLGTVSKLCF